MLGPDHPGTLITRSNLARWTGEAGYPAGAAAALEKLLADQLRVLGPDHPDTLITRHNLAGSGGRAGDPAGAAAALEKLLADQLRVLGPDHPAPWASGATWPTGPERRGTRRAPPPRSRSCWPTSCGCWAPTTPTP